MEGNAGHAEKAGLRGQPDVVDEQLDCGLLYSSPGSVDASRGTGTQEGRDCRAGTGERGRRLRKERQGARLSSWGWGFMGEEEIITAEDTRAQLANVRLSYSMPHTQWAIFNSVIAMQ